MCGRFFLTQGLADLAGLFRAQLDPALAERPELAEPRFNIRPTQEIPVLRRDPEGGRLLTSMRWGFIPAWYGAPGAGPLIINARSEGIAEKPAFREAARRTRCLIPTSGFYEWTESAGKGKEPWLVRRKGGAPMVMAGVWREWADPASGGRLRTCAIVTTEANAELAPIHHRSPLWLAPEHWGLWLGEEGHGAARLMVPPPPGEIETWRVSTALNKRDAEGEGLMAPLAEEPPAAPAPEEQGRLL
ncbi:SOS response-associated peptidase [Neomegalonema sp.]|uniref:SOS response-associated peptidase n=1 Tax=Neomegalonema sp. TaxID=2039713 RepID=UPI0026037E2F|nr:SOS response-associated peptidase [Neomegalonema sp.]MDD2868883.1 SOS response-associated peptidase [Neomegalonema sp.]